VNGPGRLVTLEGVDGAGKTTLATGLAHELRERRGLDAHVLREPGGVELAERLRAVVKDPGLRVGARAETLVYAAARAQLVEEALRPLLAAGRWVLLDRYVDSSLAYQGAARGLGVEDVAAVNEFGTGGLAPDRTLLLDRLERERDAFFDAVASAYDGLAADDPGRWRVLDAGAPAERVLDAALAAVADL